ncbi:hypothetical protein [Endozoicomonas sp. 2B-B]
MNKLPIFEHRATSPKGEPGCQQTRFSFQVAGFVKSLLMLLLQVAALPPQAYMLLRRQSSCPLYHLAKCTDTLQDREWLDSYQ